MMLLKNLNNQTIAWIKAVIFVLALFPLFNLGIAAYSDNLGANPIEKITHSTGYWTLVFLLITLTLTPLRRLLGLTWVIRLRRMLGLFAFFYGCLHFLTYMVLDQFFDWENIIKDIVKRPYITIGFSALLLMIPLAVTSTDSMIRKLGGKRWRWLHRLIYISAIGGVAHFCWLVKKDLTNPITFAILLTVLLIVRIVFWLQKIRVEKSQG